MKNLRFFVNLRPSDDGLSYMVKKCLRHFMKNLRFFVNLWSCQPMQTPILRQHNSYFIIGCPFPPGNWWTSFLLY